jgi:hypothetical protein
LLLLLLLLLLAADTALTSARPVSQAALPTKNNATPSTAMSRSAPGSIAETDTLRARFFSIGFSLFVAADS